MENKNILKLNYITNFFNRIFRKRKLIILLGRKGATLSVYNNNRLLRSIFIENKTEDLLVEYKKFLIKHRKYHIIFLLDTPSCTLKHEVIPKIQSIIESNPVEEFLLKNYKPEDIVAYKVYNISENNGEIWNTLIASSPYNYPINEILEYITHNSFKFGGIYLLSLEFIPIINKILERTAHDNFNEYMQIFAIITRSSDIKIIVKYKNNIMDMATVEYPDGKSDSYIQGTIEQAINDKLLSFKNYIKRLKLNICIIFLCDTALKELFSQLKFEEHTTIALTQKDILPNSFEEQRSQDNSLIGLFISNPTYLALNKPLKLITKLNLLNSVIFKPLIGIVISILGFLAVIQYRNFKVQVETDKLNNAYYKIAEEYRSIAKRYPELKNINNLVNLYTLKSEINTVHPTPFRALKDLLTLNPDKIELTKINWQLEDYHPYKDNAVTINVELNYIGNLDSLSQGIDLLDSYVNHAGFIFNNYHVSYIRTPENIIQSSKQLTIPAKITFIEKIGGTKNAR